MPVSHGERAAAMLAEAARHSEPGPGVTRLPFTPAHRSVLECLTRWMEAAGLRVHLDAAGTLVGRAEGRAEGPTLLLGSHQDSVPHGGAYDGILGVVLPIVALAALRRAGRQPPLPVEVLAFADEEGVRFPTALMGSRALAGRFDLSALDLRDADGETLGEAMRRFGLEPAAIAALARRPDTIQGYVEVHIEQGPVLQAADDPLGVVTAICGIERHRVEWRGRAAHAGTTPMAQRRDALAGAAEAVLAVEQLARDTPDLMATVGALQVEPNVVNAVPGAVSFTLELRSPEDQRRAEAAQHIKQRLQTIASDRRLEIRSERTYQQRAQPCDQALMERLQDAAGREAPRLPSGATHDASAMSDLCPMAMLFVRCRDGISHHPDEAVLTDDLDRAVRTLIQLIEAFESA